MGHGNIMPDKFVGGARRDKPRLYAESRALPVRALDGIRGERLSFVYQLDRGTKGKVDWMVSTFVLFWANFQQIPLGCYLQSRIQLADNQE
jgi:hypothetical protein